uniref:Uncharacterized protein n=1 Tax=Onchocerca volvulus TaxID=6282 RepID=A0A8R1TTM8_ONCVO
MTLNSQRLISTKRVHEEIIDGKVEQDEEALGINGRPYPFKT